MTLVNLGALFDSTDFYDIVEDLYDEIPEDYRRMIERKLSSGDNDDKFKTKDGGFYGAFNNML